jgi:ABC-type transport system involved in cytochrome c biogenesis permease subunit
MSNRDDDNSLPKLILRSFGKGIVAGFELMDKCFNSSTMSVVMVGLCLANLLILSDMTFRWFDGGYVPRDNFTLALINTLFLLYWYPKAKPLLFKSKQDKESSDVEH